MPQSEAFKRTFEQQAAQLGIAFEQASDQGRGTPAEVSDRAETALRNVIAAFLPPTKRVVRGQIIPVDGEKTNSIDAVILNEHHPNLVATDGSFKLILAEGVDAAIELKGRLDGNELVRLLAQARSVGRIRRTSSHFPQERNPTTAQKRLYTASFQIPFFTYATALTLSEATLAARIGDWYKTNDLRIEQRPIAYCIHNRGILLDTARWRLSMGLEPLSSNGLLWVDTKALTLGTFFLMLSRTPPSILPIARPILNRYIEPTWLLESPSKILHEYDVDDRYLDET